MRTAHYLENHVTIEDDTWSLQDVKRYMSDVFPELQNSEVRQDGQDIFFTVRAGTKGMRTAHYLENHVVIEDDTWSLQDVKRYMSDVFPELQNSEVRQEGADIFFTVRAGTKGE